MHTAGGGDSKSPSPSSHSACSRLPWPQLWVCSLPAACSARGGGERDYAGVYGLIGDRFPLAVRQIALSRFIRSNTDWPTCGSECWGPDRRSWLAWRDGLCRGPGYHCRWCSDHHAAQGRRAGSGQLHVERALARYSLVLNNPRSFVCFGIVFLEGLAIYGVMPFIGDLLRSREAGGLREAGFVIGGLGIGGLLYAFVVPLILRFASRPTMMAVGGGVAALGLGRAGFAVPWGADGLDGGARVRVLPVAQLGADGHRTRSLGRASAFSLHAFSFFMGQALGPMVYGLTLPILGATLSFALGAVVLALTGVSASRLLGPSAAPRCQALRAAYRRTRFACRPGVSQRLRAQPQPIVSTVLALCSCHWKTGRTQLPRCAGTTYGCGALMCDG